jgi:hypothetical protein
MNPLIGGQNEQVSTLDAVTGQAVFGLGVTANQRVRFVKNNRRQPTSPDSVDPDASVGPVGVGGVMHDSPA